MYSRGLGQERFDPSKWYGSGVVVNGAPPAKTALPTDIPAPDIFQPTALATNIQQPFEFWPQASAEERAGNWIYQNRFLLLAGGGLLFLLAMRR